MNPSETQFAAELPMWAARQLSDYDRHAPGTLFADGIVLSIAQGYALQSAVATLRRRRGEQIFGYKVGCTSSQIRAQLGIDHCVSGMLYDSERYESGMELSRSNFMNLAVEGELAVELSHAPTEGDFARGGIPACVSRVLPVIELHHHVMRGTKPSAGELIANNALHAGFVAGPGVRPEDARAEPSLSIHADNELLDGCAGTPLLETIHSSLEWLMRQRGDELRADHVILTGSIPSLIRIVEPCRIRVDAPPFGSVEATIF